MDGEQKLRAIIGVAAIICIGAMVVTGIVMHAPRTSTEVERAQRTTAPWLTGERR